MKKRRESNIGVALKAEEVEAAVETALDRAGRPQVVEGASEESWKTSVRKSAVERSLEEMLFEVVSSHLVLFFFGAGGYVRDTVFKG